MRSAASAGGHDLKENKLVVTAFDIALIIVAATVMLAGLYRRWCLQREKTGPVSANWSGLLGYLAGHGRIGQRQPAGLMHLLLVWGFALFVIAVILAQFDLRVGAATAMGFSLLLDIAGLAMLVATLYFLIRRMSSGKDPEAVLPKRTILPIVVLLVIVLSGFWAEGARLNLVPASAVSAPVGTLVAAAAPSSPLFMQAMIRVHFFAVLFFVALIPFTFMRHLVACSRNVLYGSAGPCAAMEPVALEKAPFGPQSVADLSLARLRDADACVACGRCDEHCPARLSGKPLSPRSIMMGLAGQADQVCTSTGSPRLSDVASTDAIWACSTCMACVAQCPVYNKPLDAVLALRRYQVLDAGNLPSEARPMIRNLELFGDVNGKGAAHRSDWTIGSQVPKEPGASKVLFWVGCSGTFHPGYQQASLAMVKIFEKAGENYAILGSKELCCGDPARRLGKEDLFVSLATKNIEQFGAHHIDQIVTLCPHCFNTLKNEYPALGAKITVQHAAEYTAALIAEGRISLKYPFADSIAIHDPCYLGRYNGIYEPLRKLCAAVPGATVKELPDSFDKGFCCGGGGGRMWLHESIGEKINVMRARQVAEAGVAAVATACPYCLTMMEDGLKALELETTPVARDIIVMVADALA
jgi:Fe-S oxidoreductase/nitrate reductase gamma subunit